MVSVRVLTVLVLATVVVLIVLSQKVNLNLDLVSLGDLDPCGLLQSLRIPSLTEVIENRECVRTAIGNLMPAAEFLFGPGGHFNLTSTCRGRLPLSRTAVVIPYRARKDNLDALLAYIHFFLMQQEIEYKIYVISQIEDGTLFNRGKLMNIGFRVAMAELPWECVVFHDVDHVPEDVRNVYKCSNQPVHMNSVTDLYLGTEHEDGSVGVPYAGFFGGVTAFPPAVFETVNGFSNEYFGWGGEDDDLRQRMASRKVTWTRTDPAVGRYRTLKHGMQPPNDERYTQLSRASERVTRDGLSTLDYRLVGLEKRPLYTNVTVDLKPHKRD